MNKLKSCLFCGGKAEINILGKECVACIDCNAKMSSDYTPIETLVDMWNKRVINEDKLIKLKKYINSLYGEEK